MTPDPITGVRLRALAIALCLVIGVLACTRAGRAPAPAGAQRIVAIGGPVTEIVFALGRGDRVIAVDASSVFPPDVTHLPQVGYQRTLSAEPILAHDPDLVIASGDAGPPSVIAQLRAAGVRVELIPTAQTVDEAARRIVAVGAALHAEEVARTLAEHVREEAQRARERCCVIAGGDTARRAPRVKAAVIYARGAGTVMLAGSDTPAAAMLELAGARNAVGSFSGYKPISAEALVAAAPDVIVVPSRGLASIGGEPGLLAVPGLADTPAGRAHRVVAIDDLLLLGFGPRLPAAIDELARRFAP
ncbi:MAG TPA: ABC transporter substrate-binding protein [Kofleriaceae bacterium]|nr:ABC transporter substrate-binding protein [Kofleriaceae bacterium]